MESADGAARTLLSIRRLSRGPPFGRAQGWLGLSHGGQLLSPPAPHSQESADPQKTAFLLRKQWALYSVTPLYKFCDAHLKDYARLLSAFIAAEKQKGLAVEVGVELDIKVTVSSVPDLKGSDRDQAAILVQVRSLPGAKSERIIAGISVET
ncbi:PREDICTED: centromere protein L-like [Calidris pugnax]|uniref:centromere protein L-like n=1 Tax=Calidris pugnax TaxID=198806 RepID=UPI00071D2199|nr:PREDICTED: centromere protein L-like [Calidris pugnax]